MAERNPKVWIHKLPKPKTVSEWEMAKQVVISPNIKALTYFETVEKPGKVVWQSRVVGNRSKGLGEILLRAEINREMRKEERFVVGEYLDTDLDKFLGSLKTDGIRQKIEGPMRERIKRERRLDLMADKIVITENLKVN